MATRNRTQPLPALDLPGIQARAFAWVDAQIEHGLGRHADDPEKVIEVTQKLLSEASDAALEVRSLRDGLALSIREYGPDATEAVPRNARNVRLAEAAGISRPRLQTLRNAWPGEVPLHLNARERLPEVAAEAATYKFRADRARERRDEAIANLMHDGWKNIEIARLTGFDASRAAHLRAELRGVPDEAEPGLAS